MKKTYLEICLNFFSNFKIPNDAEKLKKIGNFCLKTKTKDLNCETMLRLLKEKFKNCEKKPKTDTDCQTFKVQFCSAFTNFPCCADVSILC